MRILVIACALALIAGNALACPMHTAGTHDGTVAQSDAAKKPQPSNEG